MKQQKDNIELTIINAEKLEPGLQAQHVFFRQGGTIGADYHNDWQLSDRLGQIASEHCRIDIQDHQFCLRDLSGHTFVNGASFPVGAGQIVRLKDEDELRIGPYFVRVSFEKVEPFYAEEETAEIEQLLEHADVTTDQVVSSVAPSAEFDPLLALDELESDLLAEQQKCFVNPAADELQPEHENLLATTANTAAVTSEIPQADSQNTINAAFNSTTYGETPAQESEPMNDPQNDFYSYDADASQPSLSSEQHLAVGPIFRGLDVPLSQSGDTAEMQQIGEELGSALKATINGLLGLHENVDKQRYGVIAKNLQPIEDNPLRLGLGYEQTVNVMFGSNKSQVHLSAPAAISESLKTIQYHQIAVQEAISYALNHILSAFSPDTLIKRFKHYRTAEQAMTNDNDSWAWGMYQAYFKELSSGRQQGFEKLFWEVFEQAYDRKLRELQQERG